MHLSHPPAGRPTAVSALTYRDEPAFHVESALAPAYSELVGRWLECWGAGGQIHQFFVSPALPADRPVRGFGHAFAALGCGLDVIGGGNVAAGVLTGPAP